MLGQDGYGTSLYLPQFCCESQATLKNIKSFLKKAFFFGKDHFYFMEKYFANSKLL